MEFVQASVRLNCSAIGLEILWESEYLEAQVGLSDYQKKKNNKEFPRFSNINASLKAIGFQNCKYLAQ